MVAVRWAEYAITGVHYERYGQNNQWKRIVEVEVRDDNGDKLGNAQYWKRQQVVDAIKRQITFVTAYNGSNGWKMGAKVEAVRINGTEFIRTDRNTTAEDNLGSLPEY